MNTLYIDGSAIFNPGPGGWCVAWKNAEGEIDSITGSSKDSTNNRMELEAAIQALALVPEGEPTRIVTDSQYVQRGATVWLENWKRNKWRNSQRRVVANIDLWSKFDKAASNKKIKWIWVRAHTGDVLNEYADRQAYKAAEDARLALYANHEVV